jgi:hypothetical protein
MLDVLGWWVGCSWSPRRQERRGGDEPGQAAEAGDRKQERGVLEGQGERGKLGDQRERHAGDPESAVQQATDRRRDRRAGDQQAQRDDMSRAAGGEREVGEAARAASGTAEANCSVAATRTVLL